MKRKLSELNELSELLKDHNLWTLPIPCIERFCTLKNHPDKYKQAILYKWRKSDGGYEVQQYFQFK